MTSAREQILKAIRRSLGGERDERRAAAERRLAQPPRNLVPARAQRPAAELVGLFETMAKQASATIDRVADLAAVPGAVRRFLDAHDLPLAAVLAPSNIVASLPWAEAEIDARVGSPTPSDQTSVTPCFVGIAESGSLMMLSGRDHPYTLNLTVGTHIAVLAVAEIVGPYEEAWEKLRRDGPALPRTMLWITGPSRTADVAQQMLFGAHGPQRLHILMVGAG